MDVFAIAHSNHDAAQFLALLQYHDVQAVADVRSQPFSRRFPHFRKAALQQQLEGAGLRYVFLGRELGARRAEPECCPANGLSATLNQERHEITPRQAGR